MCAALTLRVSGEEVLNSGWKASGVTVHVVALGSNTTLPNPLAVLAVIEPVVPVLWSVTVATWPPGASARCTVRLSPGFIRKSLLRFGMKCSGCSAFAGAVDCPFLVMNAKFTGSGPAVLRHAVLLNWPVFWFSENVSMVSAAHHRVASHPMPIGCGTQPGG